jgi:dTDP-glucose pyrophosphorylase
MSARKPKAGIHLVLPMAGTGSRFSACGYTTPKPLIPVEGLPMFRKALSSSLPHPILRTTFILPQAGEQSALATEIRAAVKNAGILAVRAPTNGPAETCLEALSLLRTEEAVLVLDCDIWFRSAGYSALVDRVIRGDAGVDGAVLTFRSRDPRYSYAEVRGDEVVRTAEKVPISEHALIGAYFFADSVSFGEALVRSLKGGENKTSTIAPVYNEVIRAGGKVGWAAADESHSFGTPEELERFLGA